MSRTYRKCDLTDSMSKKRYVDKHMERLYRHYSYEYYMTEGDEIAYKNKEVINKILKDDISWEDKPFPDTYLGKQYIWNYW